MKSVRIRANDEDGGTDNNVNFDGKYFRLKNARLYTPPSTDIPLYMLQDRMQFRLLRSMLMG